MKNLDFKNTEHLVGDLKIRSRGEEVAKGYKPDLTLVDHSGQVKFIFECERGTNRKAFLGALVKAEKYAREHKASPTLVFVMRPVSNTTVAQIADHLQPYLIWLDGLIPRGVNIAEVLVLSDDQYLSSIRSGEIIGSPAFRARARAFSGRVATAQPAGNSTM